MTRIAPENRSAALRYWHRRAEQFRGSGLTTHGGARVRRKNFRHPEDRRASERVRTLSLYHRRAARNRMAGLTARGGQRVYNLRQWDRAILEAEIDALAASLESNFAQLSPRAQANALRLGLHLAALKGKLK